jgi:pimeloyl-ACP methyl ester carboxylesterase
MTATAPRSGYAPVNGLQMYYEIHGSGRPLVLLHGAYMTIETMEPFLAPLAKTRHVIAVELQAHGRTADIDRPLTYEQMADDTAALIRHLGIENADVLGYSMGGAAAIQLAIRHPGLVRKVVVASAAYASDGAYPEMYAMIETITPELFAGSPWEAAYKRTAPNPDDFPTLVEKLKQLDLTPFNWPAGDIRAIAAPTLIIIGDSDATRPEHAVEMFRLLGGGVMGDLAGLPRAQLAIIPGTHHLGMLEHVDWYLPMVNAFLDAPLPEGS